MPKKKSVKKPAKKAKKAKPAPKQKKKLVGKIRHFFPHISVAVVDLSGDLKAGDSILVEGSTTSFSQKVQSMQIEHQGIGTARKGQAIGLKVKEKVREGDKVYLAK